MELRRIISAICYSMGGTGDLGLNLNSLNDSMASSMSTTIRDLYSYSNLNSASSLSWADDEVENYATMKVQHYLDNLEDYLNTGILPSERCFNQFEAEQWRQLVAQFKLHELLKESRKQISEEKLRMNPIKKELEIQGHSFVHLPSNKYGSSTMGYSSHFQTPRVRSAYPVKKQAQPIRIRSAYPLKSPPLPNSGLRAGARSGYANDRSLYRSRSPLKNDYMKILDDTARLSLQKDMSVTGGEILPFNKSSSPSKSYTQLKRIKLQPSALPRFTENVPETAILPPLSETRVRSKAKPKTNHVAPVTNLKSANGNFKTVNGDSSYSTAVSGRKPTSAAQHRNMPPLSKPGQHQQYRQMYNIPTATFRSGNSRSDMEVSIELVGTSLSLFEPIARPPRPIPKLRTNF